MTPETIYDELRHLRHEGSFVRIQSDGRVIWLVRCYEPDSWSITREHYPPAADLLNKLDCYQPCTEQDFIDMYRQYAQHAYEVVANYNGIAHALGKLWKINTDNLLIP